MTDTQPNHFIDNIDLLIASFLVASGVGTLVYVVNPAAMASADRSSVPVSR